MPAKNSIKTYITNGIYHAYNRGVEKRTIFLDERDYATFIFFLKYYLSPPNPKDIQQIRRSLFGKVELLSFCLMPNHYHFLLKQTAETGMTDLIRAISTNFAMYFNNRYKRVGALFQGKYKAVLVQDTESLLQVCRYIHQNPIELIRVGPLKNLNQGSDPLSGYQYSSYPYYIDVQKAAWLNTQIVLSQFSLSTHESKTDSIEKFKNFTLERDFTLSENFLLDFEDE